MGKQNKRVKVEAEDDVILSQELKNKKQKKEKQAAVGDPYDKVKNERIEVKVEGGVTPNTEQKKKQQQRVEGDATPNTEQKKKQQQQRVEGDATPNTEQKKKQQQRVEGDATPNTEQKKQQQQQRVEGDATPNTEQQKKKKKKQKKKKQQKNEKQQAVGGIHNEVKTEANSTVANVSNGPVSESDNASKGSLKKKKEKTQDKKKELAKENVQEHAVELASNGAGKKKRKHEKSQEVADENVKTNVVENFLSGTGDKIREGFEAATDSKTIAVSGLPIDMKEKTIFDHFRSCGFITQISVSTLSAEDKFSGLAFIEFEAEDAAKRALGLNGTKLGARSLKVEPSRVRPKKKGPPAKISGCKIAYIGNLPRVVTEDDIKQFFKDSKIESIDLALYKTGKCRCRGFGHVFFADDESLENAIKKNNVKLNDKPVKVAYPVEKYTVPSKKKKVV
ncbi:hypothetical protein SUGI_0460960 [Cryptomeria japonica]|uniref:nucleolin 2 n=1 Tax=Cryptomeria japonica TaxID=3369 RepID=UPI002408E21D|nr:nucleolin 2 [Cryptomeria japonica]GLJ24165.1 hypothetical protein SUGI_0460960 [Cryptomeria japonica]